MGIINKHYTNSRSESKNSVELKPLLTFKRYPTVININENEKQLEHFHCQNQLNGWAAILTAIKKRLQSTESWLEA